MNKGDTAILIKDVRLISDKHGIYDVVSGTKAYVASEGMHSTMRRLFFGLTGQNVVLDFMMFPTKDFILHRRVLIEKTINVLSLSDSEMGCYGEEEYGGSHGYDIEYIE